MRTTTSLFFVRPPLRTSDIGANDSPTMRRPLQSCLFAGRTVVSTFDRLLLRCALRMDALSFVVIRRSDSGEYATGRL